MRRLSARVFLLGGVLAGCYVGVGYYDPYYYDNVYWDPYYYRLDASLVQGWTEAAGVAPSGQAQTAPIDPDATAAAIAARAGADFLPAGCATATATGARVAYVFTACEGRFGVGAFSGKATLTVSEAGGKLQLDASSFELVLDGRAFVLDVSATVEGGSARRVVAIESGSRSPTHVDARAARGSVAWAGGTACIEVEGESDSRRGALRSNAKLSAYRHCEQACPAAGDVSVESTEGVFRTGFDGSSRVVVVGPDGEDKRYELRCP